MFRTVTACASSFPARSWLKILECRIDKRRYWLKIKMVMFPSAPRILSINRLIIIFLALFIAGCATAPGISLNNRQRLFKLERGMSKKEALRVMGKSTQRASDGLDGKLINNPYISETLQGKDRVFDVIYYLTADRDIDSNTPIRKADLTPLFFDNDKLIGWGTDFLDTMAGQYGITLPVEKVEQAERKKKKRFLGGVGLGGVGSD